MKIFVRIINITSRKPNLSIANETLNSTVLLQFDIGFAHLLFQIFVSFTNYIEKTYLNFLVLFKIMYNFHQFPRYFHCTNTFRQVVCTSMDH